MKNLTTVMSHGEAIEQFEAWVLPVVIETYEQDGVIDIVARCEEWNNWTDMLCKDGDISDWQYENWSQPECCGRNVYRPLF
jgi:hypothetical protein